MKKLVISTLFVMQVCFVFAQSSGVRGKVIDSKTQKPLQNVVTSIANTNLTQITDKDGKFLFSEVAIGNQILQIKSQGYKDQLLKIEIEKGKIIDIGIAVLDEDITQEQQAVSVTISETELSDEGSGSENTASLLQSSRDAFLQAAAYNFGQARFSVRGIDNEYSNVMINGISMNRVADGRPQYGDWGGLNDATRNQEFTNGSAPSDYVFGGIAGTQEINTRASLYRKGNRISFLNTNTNYAFRAMGTIASGMSTNGWAYAVSASRRWAQEAYFEGTNYSANSLFASVEKKFNDKHSLNFTSVYAQNKRGKNSPNSLEAEALAGDKYNSYWGYQNGERRNSRVKKSEEPILMLTHFWKINDKNRINTSVSYQIGEIGNSRIDYKGDVNPDPVYYTNLPSYFETLHTGGLFTPKPDGALAARANFANVNQVNWKKLYESNQTNNSNAYGGKYIFYEDRNDENILTFNTNIASKLSDNILFNAGINYLDSRTKNFKNALDLLGANFYIDENAFGKGIQKATDVDDPYRSIKVGDKYGYNYDINATKIEAFTQFKFVYKKIDFYLAENFSKSTYQRDGKYRNGYYLNDSKGESKKMEFDNFGFKGGLTYKISGRQYLDFNGIYMTKAPNTKDVFSNSRVNNNITENITSETIKGVDASYIIKAPSFKARLTGYFSETLNSTDINFYYSDINASFVNEVVTGINRKNRGGELGLEYQLTSTLKLTGVAAYGEYTYTNNPNVRIFDDADVYPAEGLDFKESKIEGYKQAGTPQQAYSFGWEYRDPKFWWIGANINYLADTYVDVSTLSRTNNFYDSDRNIVNGVRININQAKADEFLLQEKLAPIKLLNLVGGKSWRIKKQYNLGLFANINNVLDFKYKTGGFEQARSATYRDIAEDRIIGTAGPFPTKYFSGYGRTYSVNLYLSF
jgi:CarboxypepD_reg-like domain/TonB-dependent Receptor Plug Domain